MIEIPGRSDQRVRRELELQSIRRTLDEAYLEVRRDDDVEFVRLADSRLTLGRERANTVSFPSDVFVSRFHAALEPVSEGWLLRELGSANGTFVNGAQLTAERILEAGDEIGVGDSRLVFRAGAGATAIHPVVEPADPAHRPTADAAGSRDLNEQRRPARAEPDRTPAQTNARQGPVQPDARPSIELFLAVAGSVCGALIANALSNTASPTVRLTGAVLGAGVPPLITIAGPWRRLRVSVGIMVAIGALVITYFGATLFDYARGKTETFPLPAAMPKPTDPNLPHPLAPNGDDPDGDGYVAPGDCNPLDPSIHPDAPDTPGDGIDQDCDGQDASVPPPVTVPTS